MMDMTHEQIAAKLAAVATEIRGNPARWTQGMLSRDAEGHTVEPENQAATCWCAYGFIDREFPPCHAENVFVSNHMRRQLKEMAGEDLLVEYNDHPDRIAENVAALFEATAARIRAL